MGIAGQRPQARTGTIVSPLGCQPLVVPRSVYPVLPVKLWKEAGERKCFGLLIRGRALCLAQSRQAMNINVENTSPLRRKVTIELDQR